MGAIEILFIIYYYYYIQVSNPIPTRHCILPTFSNGFVELLLCEFKIAATLCKCSVDITQYTLPFLKVVLVALL